METSIVDVVIGMQYGDEGKGKIANQMAASGEYDYVFRFNGGGNAGHTIYLNGEKIVTHLVPCGILHGIPSVIGNGCVINAQKLFEEIKYLKGLGFDTSLLKIARNAHIITQEHIDECVRFCWKLVENVALSKNIKRIRPTDIKIRGTDKYIRIFSQICLLFFI